MTEIIDVGAREILDNRLEPTLQVTVETVNSRVAADVPTGRSRGELEAVERRDGDDRYRGLGVRDAVSTVENRIGPMLEGRSVTAQRQIDHLLLEMDGTADKSELGGNTVTGVSLACLKAGAMETNQPLYRYVGGANAAVLPIPFFDLIEGGELSGSGLPFQEHQVVPIGAESVSEAIRMGAEVYYELGEFVESTYGEASLNVGNEGGYNPIGMNDPRDAFDILWRTIEELGYSKEFGLAADVAATHFYDADADVYSPWGDQMTHGELVDFYAELVDTYPIVSLEDPLHEHDFDGFATLTADLDIQIIGDDLFVTNPDRIRDGIRHGAANAVLWKVNQVGTVTEAVEAAELAVRSGYGVQVSERSGQTADTWLADLAVGLGGGQIKTGVTRSERTEQYNRLLAIEDELGTAATYGGAATDRLRTTASDIAG